MKPIISTFFPLKLNVTSNEMSKTINQAHANNQTIMTNQMTAYIQNAQKFAG